MKTIKLTQGKEAIVDDADYVLLSKHKWCALRMGRKWYAVRGIYQPSTRKIKLVQMHRVILGLTDPKIHCDHIDHNGLNNQRTNLRSCTKAQNNKNKSAHHNAVSKYVGVGFTKRTGKWRATLVANGKVYSKNFNTEREAAIGYNELTTYECKSRIM